jgi:hypothetical protein
MWSSPPILLKFFNPILHSFVLCVGAECGHPLLSRPPAEPGPPGGGPFQCTLHNQASACKLGLIYKNSLPNFRASEIILIYLIVKPIVTHLLILRKCVTCNLSYSIGNYFAYSI